MQLLQAEPTRARWVWRQDGAMLALVILAALACFANSLPNGFVYDDIPMLEQNARLDHPWDLRTFFTTSYWGPDEPQVTALYRPLTVWLFAVERAVFGPGPAGFHAVNVVGNALLGGLVYILLWGLIGNRPFALLGSLLYAVHPVHTEVVANGVGQSEILAGLCVVAAVCLHLQQARQALPRADQVLSRAARRRGETATDTAGGGAGLILAGAGSLYFVGLLIKESAVVLPGLAFLGEWLILRQGRLREVLRRWRTYAVYAPGLLLYLALRAAVIGSHRPAVQEVMVGASPPERLLYAWEVLLRSVGQTVVPLSLCAEYSDYSRRIAGSFTAWRVGLILTGVGLGLGLAVWLWRRRLWIPLFGLAWFMVAILPVSNLLFPIGTVRAERLLFVPSLGLIVGLGWLLAALRSRQRDVGIAVSLAVLGVYAWRTTVRNLDWRSPQALWETTLRQNPGSAIAWSFVGDVHRDRGDFTMAADHYRRAIELRDGAGFAYPEAHSRYAGAMVQLGRPAEAEPHYRQAIAQNPRYFPALNNLGELRLQAGALGEAADLFQRAAEVRPEDFMPWANLAQAASLAGDYDRALAAIDRAIQRAPTRADVAAAKADILDRQRAAGKPPPNDEG